MNRLPQLHGFLCMVFGHDFRVTHSHYESETLVAFKSTAVPDGHAIPIPRTMATLRCKHCQQERELQLPGHLSYRQLLEMTSGGLEQ